ncbi:hypothetical protein [Pedobacter sp. NJ-S-72]
MIELKTEFSEYIKNFEEKLKLLFRGKDNTDQFDLAAKMPPSIMKEILAEQSHWLQQFLKNTGEMEAL